MIIQKFSVLAGMLLFCGEAVLAQELKFSICGQKDDRVRSTEPRTFRALKEGEDDTHCTGALIGRSCAVTAGHCRLRTDLAEFNVGDTKDDKIDRASPENQYHLQPGSITYKRNGVGDDYAVYRLQPNAVTGLYPGDVQGHYEVKEQPAAFGNAVRITGYGTSYDEKTMSQQTHVGELLSSNRALATLYYNVDTTPGVSGAAVIDEPSGQLVGIHTHGGCTSRFLGANRGTSVHHNVQLAKAVKLCLDQEIKVEKVFTFFAPGKKEKELTEFVMTPHTKIEQVVVDWSNVEGAPSLVAAKVQNNEGVNIEGLGTSTLTVSSKSSEPLSSLKINVTFSTSLSAMALQGGSVRAKDLSGAVFEERVHFIGTGASATPDADDRI